MSSAPFESVDWRDVATCVLDMDGTLLDLHFDNQFWHELLPRRFAERSGMPEARARQHVRDSLAAARGTLDGYCMEHWSRVFDLELTAIEAELRDLISVRPGTVAFLDLIRDNGIRLILATNAHPASMAHKLEVTGIGPYFDVIISSHEFGYAKEHIGFWQTLAEHCTVDPERTLFIDDNRAVLETARRFGIRYLFGVALPDSRGARIEHDDFHRLDHLIDVTSNLSGAAASS